MFPLQNSLKAPKMKRMSLEIETVQSLLPT